MKHVTVIAAPAHQARVAAFADDSWTALKSATPDEIDAWLVAHVNTVADARQVLRMLIIASRYFLAREMQP